MRLDIHLKRVDNKFKACSACCPQTHCQEFRKGLCCTPKPQGADRLREQKQHARTAVSAIAFALGPESLRHCRIPSMNLKGAGGCVAMFASVHAVIAHLQQYPAMTFSTGKDALEGFKANLLRISGRSEYSKHGNKPWPKACDCQWTLCAGHGHVYSAEDLVMFISGNTPTGSSLAKQDESNSSDT